MTNMPYHIFYTDDDDDDQDLFREVVGSISEGHQVFTQSHGGELMETLKQPPPAPDLIFLDLNMPHKNGYEVLEEMRATTAFKNIPVIVFSTSDSDDVINTCKTLGANMYLSKPGSYPDLKKLLQSVLSIDWKTAPVKPSEFVHLKN